MLRKIEIPPGIDKDSTQYAAAGHWYDMNNMRFRGQVPEMIGGWSRDEMYTLQGLGRGVFSSRDYVGNNYQFVGTNWKFYVIVGGVATDITPVELTTTADPPSGGTVTASAAGDVDCVIGSALLTIEIENHGLSVNDWMVITDSDQAGSGILPGQGAAGMTDEILEQVEGFQVAQVLDANNFVVWIVDWATGEARAAASSEDTNQTLEWYTRVASGVNTYVLGTGFGAGDWGGDGIPTTYELAPTPLTTDSDDTIVIEISGTEPSPTIQVDDQFYLRGLEGTVGGINTDILNDNWWNVSSIAALGGSDKVELQLDFDALSGAGGGGTTGSYYRGYQTGLSAVAIVVADPAASVDGATRGWGAASQEAELTATLRRVYIDNFGEDILMCNSGGPIYYWDTSAKVSSGIPVTGEDANAVDLGNTTIFEGTTGAPVTVGSFLVSKRDGHVIALCANDIDSTVMNTMLVRWSDQNNPFDWTPSTTNTSGGQVLRVGSNIVCGVSTKDEVLIFTNSAVYSMRYLGPNSKYVFGFNLVTEGVEILGSSVTANAANSVFFMGRDGFYTYTGSVSPLPCPVKKYVFDDMNMSQREKSFAAVNSQFSEVIWFYPGGDSFECDKYVVYNYSTDSWGIGSFDMSALPTDGGGDESYSRTSWRDAVVFSNPMATYISNYAPNGIALTGQPAIEETAVMKHEDTASVGLGNGNPMDVFIESGEIDISEGERFVFISQMIPDLQLFNVGNPSPVITVDVYGRDFPGQAQATPADPLVRPDSYLSTNVTFTGNTYTPIGNDTAMRARARSIALRLSSSDSGFQWRTGDMRFAIQPDGRR